MAPLLEAPEPGCLLDQGAPLGRLRRQHLLDPTLPDDGVHLVAEACVAEQLEHVCATYRRPVDQVLALASAMKATGDRDLRIRQRPRTVGVVEQELHLAVIDTGTDSRASEEHVLRLLGPQSTRRKAPRCPDDRISDVRLAGAVRSDDDRDAWFETDIDRIGERLEAAQPDRAQMHRGSLTPPAAGGLRPAGDGRLGRRVRAPAWRPPAPHPSSTRRCRSPIPRRRRPRPS